MKLNRGLLAGFLAYFLWGLFPIYWKLLGDVPALEILAHRMAWSLIFLVALLTVRRRWAWLGAALRDRGVLTRYTAAAILLSINWGLYIWGVNNGYIVETSLGYFINPLVNVLLGMIFLGERLRRWQMAAIGLALAGVLYLTFAYGRPPYIALVLAFSFGTYGLLKKQGRLASAEGLTLETATLFVPAAVYLIWLQATGQAAFGTAGTLTTALLAGAGVATAVPLLLFASGARSVTLTTLGILQYVAPTLQFLLGVLVYREPFDRTRLWGFVMIWIALLIYSGESLLRHRQQARRLARATAAPPL